MKGSGALIATVMAAASCVAFFNSSDRHVPDPSSFNMECSSRRDAGSGRRGLSSSEKEKFAPRFDGLRFIETLVTAHR